MPSEKHILYYISIFYIIETNFTRLFVVNIKRKIISQEHLDIRHTVDQVTTRIMLACTRRSTVRHHRRTRTCTEDTLLPPRIPLTTIHRFRIHHRPIPTIPSCRRIRTPICPANPNRPLSREVTRG